MVKYNSGKKMSRTPTTASQSKSVRIKPGAMAGIYVVIATLHAGPWPRLPSNRLIVKDL